MVHIVVSIHDHGINVQFYYIQFYVYFPANKLGPNWSIFFSFESPLLKKESALKTSVFHLTTVKRVPNGCVVENFLEGENTMEDAKMHHSTIYN